MSLFRTLLSQLSSSRLPDEYQEVEWIKGSGTQYIDTGFVANGGMTCEYIVEHNTDYTTYTRDGGYIIGSHSNSSPYGRNGGYYKPQAYSWELGYGNNYPQQVSTFVYDKKYNVKFSTIVGNAYLTVDGETLITDTSNQTISNTDVYVFNHYYNIRHNGKSTIAKLYYAKIYNSLDELVRELIPCYRKSDSAIGLYDLVNNQFYANAGTGKFSCYPSPPPPPKRLPDEYQEVDYINANNTAYINTDFKITTGIKFEFDISLSSVNEQYLLGAVYSGNPVTRSHLACFNKNGYQFGLGAKEDIWTNFFPATNTRYYIEASTISGNNYIKINGTNYGSNTYTYTLNNMNCYVGAVNGLDTNKKIRGNIYSCKIYDENETLVRDLVPCYRILDNKTGMYDIVNDVFYTSATSTDFVAGPDAN